MAKTTTAKTRARKGDGTIFTTKDGRHRAAITVQDAMTGRPVRRYLSGKTTAEVTAKLKAMRAERTPRTPTVASYGERWLTLVRHRVRPATHRIYRTAITRHIIPALGNVELGRLRPADVEAMTAEMLDRGLAPGTVALTRRVLVVALSDAERDGLVVRNVARLARGPRQREAPPRSLSVVEVRRLSEVAQGDDHIGPLVLLALSTGLRRNELLALRWEDIGPDNLAVTASLSESAKGGYERSAPKTRRSRRTVGLPAIAREALARQRELSAGSTWVFASPVTGRPLHPEAVTSAWRDLADRAGLSGVRLHDLRHTAATLALAAGVPVRDVADALGHSSPSITLNVYGHAIPEGPSRVADALDKALGGEA
jgi:integrase